MNFLGGGVACMAARSAPGHSSLWSSCFLHDLEKKRVSYLFASFFHFFTLSHVLYFLRLLPFSHIFSLVLQFIFLIIYLQFRHFRCCCNLLSLPHTLLFCSVRTLLVSMYHLYSRNCCKFKFPNWIFCYFSAYSMFFHFSRFLCFRQARVLFFVVSTLFCSSRVFLIDVPISFISDVSLIQLTIVSTLSLEKRAYFRKVFACSNLRFFFLCSFIAHLISVHFQRILTGRLRKIQRLFKVRWRFAEVS